MGWFKNLVGIAPVLKSGYDWATGGSDDNDPTPYKGTGNSRPSWQNVDPNYAPVGTNEAFMTDWLQKNIGQGTDALWQSDLGKQILEGLKELTDLDVEAYPVDTARNLGMREDILPRQKARDLLIDSTMGKGGMKNSGAFSQEKLKSLKQTDVDLYNLMDRLKIMNENAKMQRFTTGMQGFKMGGDYLQNLIGALGGLTNQRIASDTSSGNAAQSASASRFSTEMTGFSNEEHDALAKWIAENNWARDDAKTDAGYFDTLIKSLVGQKEGEKGTVSTIDDWLTKMFSGNKQQTTTTNPITIPKVDYSMGTRIPAAPQTVWEDGSIVRDDGFNPYIGNKNTYRRPPGLQRADSLYGGGY